MKQIYLTQKHLPMSFIILYIIIFIMHFCLQQDDNQQCCFMSTVTSQASFPEPHLTPHYKNRRKDLKLNQLNSSVSGTWKKCNYQIPLQSTKLNLSKKSKKGKNFSNFSMQVSGNYKLPESEQQNKNQLFRNLQKNKRVTNFNINQISKIAEFQKLQQKHLAHQSFSYSNVPKTSRIQFSNPSTLYHNSLLYSKRSPIHVVNFPQSNQSRQVIDTAPFNLLTERSAKSTNQQKCLLKEDGNSKIREEQKYTEKIIELKQKTMDTVEILQHNQNNESLFNSISIRKFSDFEPTKRLQICESRYIETPKLDKSDLKTIQSMISESASVKKQVQQSIIVVDFFNPSEQVKRQIQSKIMKRKSSHFGN